MAERQQIIDIYLSTSRLRNDIEFARKLFSDLSSWKLVVYLDMENTSSSASMGDQIKEAIANCTIFIPLISPASARSDILLEETKTAQTLGKPIIPVLYRATPNIPEILSVFQYIDMRGDENYATGIDQIINAVYRYNDDKNQSLQSKVSEPLVITSSDPILSSLNFVPVSGSVERRVVPFLPGPDEPQSMVITTPWIEKIRANKGDFLVSQVETPDDYWPVDAVRFEELYVVTRPGYAVLKTPLDLVPLSDLTGGDPNRAVTIISLEGPQTVRAEEGYLARGSKGQLRFISNGEADQYLGIAHEPVQNAEPAVESTAEPTNEPTVDPEAERLKKQQAAFERNRLINNRSQRIYNDRAEGEDQL